MKISINWIKQFTEVNLSNADLIEKIGAQLGEVKEVTEYGKRFEGVVVAHVVSCEKHPDADRLNVCRINDGGVVEGVQRGDDGLIQVVCGAPNVRAGLSVAWIPPGATVPSSFETDPFVLEARELRGVVSNGMLASAHELTISDDHTGILEIDIDEAAPGTAFADVYDLNDTIIDIENKMFTHRPDCFGILGVAREIAGIQGLPFKSPDWYATGLDRIKPGTTQLPLAVRNEAPELVPRFMAIALADVSLNPSPIMIQTYLSRVGLRPINNIVDVTNYLMMLTGQPLHAYDYDKVKAVSGDIPTIVARSAADNEGITLLNGKTVHVTGPTIVIATDQQPIGIGGVMGGADTEVDDQTKNIILEVATFDMYNIRKTSMKYGLFTDAVTRFNKGQSPLQNDRILEEAVATIQYVSGTHVASKVFDEAGQFHTAASVKLDVVFINARLGFDLTTQQIADCLRNVEFEVETDGSQITVTAPFWRTDISIAEDIVEEVGRLVGYDHLPLALPKREIRPIAPDQRLSFKTRLRKLLASAGANELLTYSFVHGKMLERAGQDPALAFKLSNALSPDLQYYRVSLTPSLLEKVHPNSKAGYDRFALFEFNKTFLKGVQDSVEPDVPAEFQRLSLVYTSNNKGDQARAAFYGAATYLTYLLDSLAIAATIEPVTDSVPDTMTVMLQPFDRNRSGLVYVKGDCIGVVGELTRTVRDNFKLPQHTAAFELDLLQLQKHAGSKRYAQLSRYPKVEQDISLKVPATLSYRQLYDFVSAELAKHVSSNTVVQLSPVDIYQRADDTDHKQITLRFTIASYERTLTATEVNKLLDDVAQAAATEINAIRL